MKKILRVDIYGGVGVPVLALSLDLYYTCALGYLKW